MRWIRCIVGAAIFAASAIACVSLINFVLAGTPTASGSALDSILGIIAMICLAAVGLIMVYRNRQ